jgi:murein L,D-transpeptidase YcbB/YkuD
MAAERAFLTWRWLALLVVPLLAALPTATADVGGEAAAAIREVVAAARHPEMRWPDFPFYQDEMQGLYEPVAYAPVWFADGRPLPAAHEAVDALLAAEYRGLVPADYDADRLDALLRASATGLPLAGRALGMTDAAISLAFFRQLSDRRIGRVNPKNLHVDLDIEHKKLDLAAEVRSALAAGRVGRLAVEVEPQLEQYGRVKQALAVRRALAAVEVEPVPEVKKLSPGDTWAGVGALAARLASLGDLGGDEAAALASGGVYGERLAAAVKRFQYRHGLAEDGVVGARTLAALNVPPARRVRQLELALERLRWLPEVNPRPLIVVNVPAFRLWAWGPGASAGHPSLAMDVVVGRALDRQTPLFTKEMTFVVFYPYWNVPYGITRRDVVPKLREDPAYLASQEMELVASFGQREAGTSEVTPAAIDALLRGTLKVRQRPGPANALGPAKFIMPNDADIYLHGTPAKGLFAKARRDFSSGCIRVADPAALAELVLAGAEGWDRARIEAAMAGPREQRVNLPRPVTVDIVYLTAYVESDGSVHFLDDVYGLDAKLEEAIAAGEPFPP